MLMGYKFGHYLSVNVGQLLSTSTFTEMFSGQLSTLENIEEVDRRNEAVHAQVVIFLFVCSQIAVLTE
jgi:hypothetical protein